MTLKVSEWLTHRKVGSKTHASHLLSMRTLCSGPKITDLDPKLMRAPRTKAELFAQVTCLTCTRELLRKL